MKSSILDRYAQGSQGRFPEAETPLPRLWRRLRAEIWSVLAGTRYVVVRFG